ncbi:hypothetical protein V8C37DRAFT_365523 [Trichoderma ceciliae]
MIDKLQCQTHTRTPWGKNPHRYDYRLRYLIMGLLCTSILAVFVASLVFIGNRALKNYQMIPLEENPTTPAELPVPTSNATKTNTTDTTEITNNPPYYKSGGVT